MLIKFHPRSQVDHLKVIIYFPNIKTFYQPNQISCEVAQINLKPLSLLNDLMLF